MRRLSEPSRAYIYRLLVAVATLAVAYGRVSPAVVPLWMEAACALLGIGTVLASANTSTRSGDR